MTRARRWACALSPLIAVMAAMVVAQTASAAPAQVPCSSIGGGKYNCQFWPAGDGQSGGAPVVAGNGSRVGYLNQGTNWVICQASGDQVTVGSTYNVWWAWTEANDGTDGWVNAVYAQGGDNDGSYANVPNCDTSHGTPPGGAPPPPPPPPPPPSGPAPVPCHGIGGAKYSCNWYVPGDGSSGGTPVLNSTGGTVGYLNVGSNWILCQQGGGELSYHGFHNHNYGWTEADNGSMGWANAVYASGGDNDGSFAGVPACNGAHGSPPSGSAPPPPPPPPPSGAGAACSDATGPGNNVTRWNPVVICALKLIGYSTAPSVVNDVDIIIQHESSGNPTAINLTDINAREGHPSRGLIQTIPSTFEAHRCSGLPDDIVDPAANICAGLRYGIGRYGSIENIPGIVRVHEGRSYVGYFAHLSGPMNGCSQVKLRGLRLNVSARHLVCGRARSAARTIERSAKFRHALRHHRGTAIRLRLRTHLGAFRCQVAVDHVQGRALRSVACATGRKDVSWTAVKG